MFWFYSQSNMTRKTKVYCILELNINYLLIDMFFRKWKNNKLRGQIKDNIRLSSHHKEKNFVTVWWWMLFIVFYILRPLDCSLPGFSVHGILWARILEWVAIYSSRGPSRPYIKETSLMCIRGYPRSTCHTKLSLEPLNSIATLHPLYHI